jgi:hypothetical protein
MSSELVKYRLEGAGQAFESVAKVKTGADEGDCEIQTSRKTGGIPKAVCRGFCGEV